MITAKQSTKSRILEATEQLLAEHGFESVSLRDITTAADVNVAAVNYHFGSKEKLFEEVQCRYINPVNEERLRILEQLTEGGRTPDIRELLDAFLRPFLTMVTRSKMSEQLFYKLMGRFITGQRDELPEAMMPLLTEMLDAFRRAFSDASPNLSADLLLWRLHFTFGVMAHTLLHEDFLRKFTDGECGDPNFETKLQRMIDFCQAGFLAGEGEIK